jgi:hypothetical protein
MASRHQLSLISCSELFNQVSARSTTEFEVSRHLHEADGYLEFKLFAVPADSMHEVEWGLEEEKLAE